MFLLPIDKALLDLHASISLSFDACNGCFINATRFNVQTISAASAQTQTEAQTKAWVFIELRKFWFFDQTPLYRV